MKDEQSTAAADNTVAALEGEPGIPSVTQPKAVSVSWKGVLAVALFAMTLIAVTAVSLNRAFSNPKGEDEASAKQAGQRPAAAATQPRKLDLTQPAARVSAPAPASAPVVPAIVPAPEESLPDPIGVRRHPPSGTQPGQQQRVPPEDAPVLLVSVKPQQTSQARVGSADPSSTFHGESVGAGEGPLDATRRNLAAYQQQLQGLLGTMTRVAPGENSPATAPASASVPAQLAALTGANQQAPNSNGLFGGQLQGSATPRAAASMLGDRSLTLPKGTAFTCALKTRVVSATSGFVGCQVQRNVYSDDGRVLLIERGSHMDGEYRITTLRPGTVRIPVLWTRVRTPNGVTVDLDSPGTGPLGESGIDGYVDNRWGARIGAAMLLSLIDDSVKLVIQNQANERQADTIVLPSTTGSSSKLAEKVLESTINIPPLIYQNQGGIVGVYVARDVDFSGVYELKATQQ
jgi:type IV secretion system protein VirB10